MAVSYQVPGVYIEEVPTVRSVQGVSTDIALFVGIPANFNIATTPSTPQLITSWAQYQNIFGGFIWNCYLAYAVYSFFASGGNVCYVMNALTSTSTMDLTPAKCGGSLTINVTSPWLGYQSSTESDIYVVVNNSGSNSAVFSISVLLEVDSSPAGQSNQLLQIFAQTNNLGLYTNGSNSYYILEQFTGFTLSDLEVNSVTNLAPIQQRINSASLFINVGISSITAALPTLSAVPLALGNADLNGAGLTVQSSLQNALGIEGILALTQGVSIVAIPDNVNQSLATQNSNINNLLSALEAVENAIAVIDSPYFTLPDPKDENLSKIISFVQGGDGNALNSSYGAIYYPWVWIANPVNSLQVLVPPSGLVAGRYAYTDNTIGVFAAPAGIQEGQLQLATGVVEPVSAADQQLLNPIGINAIRQLLRYGICIWGARTLSQANDDTVYVNVRRLLIFIEQSIYQSIQWVVFQPNNSTLWGTVNRDITAFLMTLWQQGALVGSSASQAFYVICDSSNNTAETMAEGILYIDVGLAPVTPAEFVVLRIAQIIQAS